MGTLKISKLRYKYIPSAAMIADLIAICEMLLSRFFGNGDSKLNGVISPLAPIDYGNYPFWQWPEQETMLKICIKLQFLKSCYL